MNTFAYAYYLALLKSTLKYHTNQELYELSNVKAGRNIMILIILDNLIRTQK